MQLDFAMEGLSLSDWFPPELLQARNESPVRRPERNVSLGVVAATGVPATSQASGSQVRSSLVVASGSGNVTAESSTMPSMLLRITETQQESNEDGNDIEDVIVIEAPRGRDVRNDLISV